MTEPEHTPTSSSPLVSLVLPAYNEHACLEANSHAILAFCDAQHLAAELLIVDDGSADDTRAIAEQLAESDRRVQALANPVNQGKGAAVRRGMLAATGRFVVFLDADLSTPIHSLPGVLEALEQGADVAIGSRRVPGAQIAVHQPWLRETMGRVFTALTRWWLRTNIADFTCGFKGFRHEAVQPIFERQQLDDWSFDAEVLFIANRLGLRIAQVPVTWRDDRDTKVRVLSATLRSLAGLWRIRRRASAGLYDFPQ